MSNRRVKFRFSFGSLDDRDVAENMAGIAKAGAPSLQGTEAVAALDKNGTTGLLLFDNQFTVSADAEAFYSQMVAFLEEPDFASLSLGLLSESFELPSLVRGKVSIHTCPHADAESTWYNCRSGAGANYTEFEVV